MLIGELSRLAGISPRMLRHYDAIGLVSPANRSANGYRDYTPDDIDRLFRVESLRTLGLPLLAIRDTLADANVTPSGLVEELIASTRKRITREQGLLRRLTGVRDSGATSWRDILDLVALMQDLHSADPSRRQRVALSDTGAVPATSIIDAVLDEEDPVVAGALQWVLARMADDALPQLVDALQSPDEQVRHRAIDAIVKIKPDSSVPALLETLHHPDPLLRERAAMALGSQGAIEAVPELLEMVVRGASDVEAAEVLGQLARQHGICEGMAGLITERLAREHQAPGARSRLTQALAEIPGTAADRTLAELTEDPDRAVSLTAGYLLAGRSGAADS